MSSQAQIWGSLGKKKGGAVESGCKMQTFFWVWTTTRTSHVQKVKAAADPKEHHFGGTEAQATVLCLALCNGEQAVPPYHMDFCAPLGRKKT